MIKALKTAGRTIVNAAGSVRLGMVLLALLAAYVGAVSVWAAEAPDSLAEILGRPAKRAYSHPALFVLGGLVAVSIVAATLTRLRWSLANAGVWICHLGVLVLAGGAAWYAAGAASGYCIFLREQGGWKSVTQFYEHRTHALYVYDGPQAAPKAFELAIRDDARYEQPQDILLAAGDAEIRVTGYFRRPIVEACWQDSSPNYVPAVELEVEDRRLVRTVLLSPAIEEQQFASGDGYTLTYQPDVSPEMLESILGPAAARPPAAVGEDLVLIVSGREIEPAAVVFAADGRRLSQPLLPGEAAGLKVAGRTIVLKALRFLEHAAPAMTVRRPLGGEQEKLAASAAVRLEIRSGQWRRTTCLPFVFYPDLDNSLGIDLPGGRTLLLCFSAAPRPLGGAVELLGASVETYGGSTMPRDYRCDLRIVRDGAAAGASVSLNRTVMVGPFQLSQSSLADWRWGRDGEADLVPLAVSRSPGLGVIWAGCAMIVLGLLWAFYVKPILLRRARASGVTLLLPLMLALLPAMAGCEGEEHLFDEQARAFAAKVDLSSLRLVGVQLAGRVGIMDTLARRQVSRIYGCERIDGLEPTFACLELYFNAGAYLDRPVLYVREKNMRRAIAADLDGDARREFEKSRRLRPVVLMTVGAAQQLEAAARASRGDVRRAAQSSRAIPALRTLGRRGEFRLPLERLGRRFEAFMGLGEINILPARQGAWVSAAEALAGEPAEIRDRVGPHLADAPAMLAALRDAWRRRDAEAVNRIAVELSARLTDRVANPACPPRWLRQLELAYNRTYHATIVWVGFAAATVFWIIAAAGARRARLAAMILMALSTAALLAGFLVRWRLSGRPWYLPPIMDQFEAVTGAALLAAVIALALELARRRNYLGLAASLYAAVSLLAGFFLPAAGVMTADITAKPGILNSPIMAVHVAVIIAGHAFVGMTGIISLAYLLVAALRRVRPSRAGEPVGGGALQSIGRCNLIAAQLACWTIVLGTILGAYWADFAWGRWWGWDPKETWALITAMVYVAIIHVRLTLPSDRRDAATAVLCLVGCAVMLFNWIYVNFFMPGLHSYA